MPKAKTEKQVHPIKELLSYFDQRFRARFGQPAPIVPGKDAKKAQGLLAVYAIEDLRRWIDAFFASFDQFICGSTYSFGVFASCIGKLIKGETPGATLKPKSVRTLQGIYGD